MSLDEKKVVVLLSGGMDSTTLLYHMLNEGYQAVSLSVDYHQRHRVELDYAKRIAARTGVEHLVAGLGSVKFCLMGGSQTDPSVDVPEGHYAADNMRLTVVPNRNMILLSLAVGLAISRGAANVAYAAHAGDHYQYPDCRPAFIDAFKQAAHLAWEEPVYLKTPFSNWTKADIVKRGSALGVPFQDTFSCYAGLDIHCGRCGTDVERRLAFIEAGVEDPTLYADRDYALTVKP